MGCIRMFLCENTMHLLTNAAVFHTATDIAASGKSWAGLLVTVTCRCKVEPGIRLCVDLVGPHGSCEAITPAADDNLTSGAQTG